MSTGLFYLYTDMSSSLMHVDSGLLKDLKNDNGTADHDRELDATMHDVSDIEDNFPEGETDEDDSVRVRKAMESLVKNSEKEDKRQGHRHETNGQRTGQRRETDGQRKSLIPRRSPRRDPVNGFQPLQQDPNNGKVNEERMMPTDGTNLKYKNAKSRDSSTNGISQDGEKRRVSNLPNLSNRKFVKSREPLGSSQEDAIDKDVADEGRGSNSVPTRDRDLKIAAGKMSSGGRRKEVEDGLDGYDASDEEVANKEDTKRRSNPLRRHVTGGSYRQQRSTDSGPSKSNM